jgi:hypothetical protein
MDVCASVSFRYAYTANTSILLPINLCPQPPRPLKCYHPPCGQNQALAGCWIPSLSLSLLFNTKLTKTANQHVLTGCETGFDEFQEVFNNFDSSFFLKSVVLGDDVDQMVFAEGHWRGSFDYNWSLKKDIIILFLSDESLKQFRASKGWEAGMDANVAVVKMGAGERVDFTKVNDPIVAFVFDVKGLMADISLKGAKFTKINPK